MQNLNELIAQHQEAQRQADALVEPPRQAIYEAATARRAELAERITPEAQQASLIAIIEEALMEADDDAIRNAPIVMHQLTATIAHPDVKAGNGAILLEVFLDAARHFEEEQRRTALEAVLLTAWGAADAGLFRFPDPWHSILSLPTLRQFAAILCPEEFRADAEQIMEAQAEYRKASQLIAEHTPVACMPAEKPPELIRIVNCGEGTPLMAAGIKLPGYGAITTVTREQLAQLQESPIFNTGVRVGDLEIMH